jgi:heme oxygenase
LPTDEEDEKLFKLTLNILNNIAHEPETKVVFQQLQAAKALKNISNIENEHLKVLIHLVLGQITTDNDFYDKSLNDSSNETLEAILYFIQESLKKDNRYKGITTTEYVNCLARLAVNKDNKEKIIKWCNGMILENFKIIFNNQTSSLECQLNCLICIWNLCYNEGICEMLKKDKEIINIINNFRINNFQSEHLQVCSSNLLFTLNELFKKSRH